MYLPNSVAIGQFKYGNIVWTIQTNGTHATRNFPMLLPLKEHNLLCSMICPAKNKTQKIIFVLSVVFPIDSEMPFNTLCLFLNS